MRIIKDALRRAKVALISNFSGGVNAQSDEISLAKNQVIEAINFNLTQVGALEKRKGYTSFANQLSAAIDSGYYYKTSSVDEFVVGSGGSLYKKNTDGTWTSIYTATNSDFSFAVIHDRLFIVNGVDDNKKWDGTNLTNVGIQAPSSAPILAAGAAGNLNGTYKYAVTFYRGGNYPCESNPSPLVEITVSNQQVDLSNIPTSSDPQVTARRIYRTTANGGTLYLVAEINDNTTTTYTDNATDESLGDALSYDRSPFPKAKQIAVSHNRLWGVAPDGTAIYYSNFNRPEEWDELNTLYINPGDGEIITAIVAFRHYIVAFKENSIYFIDARLDPPPYYKISDQIGCTIPRSVAATPIGIIFANHQGIYALNENGQITWLSEIIDKRYNTLLDKTSADTWWGVYYPERFQYFLAARKSGLTENNYWLVFDVRTKGWTFYELKNGASCFIKYIDSNQKERVIFGTSDGYTFLFDEGNSDNGNAIKAYMQTRWTPLDNFVSRKRIFKVYPLVKVEERTTIKIKVFFRFIEGGTIYEYECEPAAIWGTSVWGDFIWGHTGTQQGVIDVNVKGTWFSFYLEHEDSKWLRVMGFGCKYQQRGFADVE